MKKLIALLLVLALLTAGLPLVMAEGEEESAVNSMVSRA